MVSDPIKLNHQQTTQPQPRPVRLAWLPIPIFLLVMAALWISDLRVAWPLPPLNWFVHYGSVALGLAFIVIPAARSFLANGQLSVLMLGCGVLMMDIGVIAMPTGFARSSDAAFAIYNTSVLLAALCHFAGVTITSGRKSRLRRSALWLTAAYAGGIAATGLVIWGALTGRMPVFFIDGQGGTLLRTLVVSVAVALFVLTAGLLWQANRRAPSPFLYWYALGLVLLAAGLTGSMLIAVRDSPLQWVSRFTQFFGGIYMCVAVLASVREKSAKPFALGAVEEAWRANVLLAGLRQQSPLGWGLRYSLAVVAVVLAMGLWQGLTAWAGAALPPYITFYPMVMAVALLFGFGPGVVATALAGLVAGCWLLPPAGQFAIASPADRLGLVVFAGMGLFMSAVAEVSRRYRHKAAAYDRDLALRESGERLNLALAATELGTWDYSPITGALIWDKRCKALFGLPPEADVNYDTFLAGLHPQDRERTHQVVQRALDPADGHPFDTEYRTVGLRDGGVVRWIRATGRAFFRETGQTYRFIGTVQDITDRKLAEEALCGSERFINSVATASPHWFYVFDFDTMELSYSNRPILRDLGYPPDVQSTVTGLAAFRAFMPPEEMPHLARLITEWQALPDGLARDDEYRLRHADGTLRHFVGRELVFARRPDGTVQRILGTLLDITPRIQAEEALRQYRKDLDHAQAVAQIGSWRLDVGRNVLTWSDENHRIFGVPKGTPLTYEAFLGSVHPDDRQYVDTQWKAGLAGAPYDIEHRIVAGGQVKWVREKAYLEFDDAGKLLGGFGITQDITERKRAEAEHQRHTQDLQSANQDLIRFNQATVGREIRMVELKKEINDLCAQTGQPPRYATNLENEINLPNA